MYLPYVNIKMGTDSSMRFSRGNTLPLTQLPFAMASFCPQTEVINGQESWFYKPHAPYLEGIRLTHQPSPWIDDYGTFLLTPQSDVISNTPSGAYSGMRVDEAELMPHYLKVKFLRSCCTFRLVPTLYGGAFSLDFENEQKSYLSIFGIKGDYSYELNEKTGLLLGTTNGHSKDASHNFKMYFAIQLSKDDIDTSATYKQDNNIHIALKGKSI